MKDADGFDYGDGWTKAESPGPLVEWRSDYGEWKSRPGIHLQLLSGERYRRPMTEAEKQAEKAKEDKVNLSFIEIKEIHFKTRCNGRTDSFVTISEAAQIAQLPEVVAEVERQRKEREIKIDDAVFDHRFSRWWIVKDKDDVDYYSAYNDDGSRFCGRSCDLIKITMDEYKVLESVKVRALLEKGAK